MGEYKLTTEPFNAIDELAEPNNTYVTANGWLFYCTEYGWGDEDHLVGGLLMHPLGRGSDVGFICDTDNRIHSEHGTLDELTLVARVIDLTTTEKI